VGDLGGDLVSRILRSSSASLGRAFEHRVRDALTAQGWWVIRAAGSKGKADLVALRATRAGGERVAYCALINVKRGGKVSPAEWNEMWDLAVLVGAFPVVAFMPGARGIEWRLVTGPKNGSGRPQPWTNWEP
jgi:hypothetical protein